VGESRRGGGYHEESLFDLRDLFGDAFGLLLLLEVGHDGRHHHLLKIPESQSRQEDCPEIGLKLFHAAARDERRGEVRERETKRERQRERRWGEVGESVCVTC
jgi:hypothetical protein